MLHPKYIFGFNEKTKKTIFTENSNFLYSAGNTIVEYSLEQRTQRFLHGVEKGKSITSFAVSSNKQWIAVGQLIDEKPAIVVFDLKQNKRKKTMKNPDNSFAKEFIALNFNLDSTHIFSLTGGSEFYLGAWKWEKGKLMASIKISTNDSIFDVVPSPVENFVIAIFGKFGIRFYRYNDGHFKQFGHIKSNEAQSIFCGCWKADKFLAGNSDGKILFYEKGELRFDLNLNNIKIEEADKLKSFGGNNDNKPIAASSLELRPAESSNLPKQFLGKEVTAITIFGRGFAVSFGIGLVAVFEDKGSTALSQSSSEINGFSHYKQICVARIPDFTLDINDRIIKSLAINPTNQFILAVTLNNQIYKFEMTGADLKDHSEMQFEYAICSFHNGSIRDMDVAIQKPLLVSCGSDRFVRIWNFQSMTQEAARQLADEVFSVAMHPNGLSIVVCCLDKIRVMTILQDHLQDLYEFPIRGCKECAFSYGGHLFAFVNGNIIQVYSSITFENILNMKGHNNKIKKLLWSLDDSKLISVGADDAIYEWDISQGKRTNDIAERGTNLVSVAISPDKKTHYAINAKNYIKEIQIVEGMILKEVDLGGITPTTIMMSRSGKFLISGYNEGTIRSFKLPLANSGDWLDYRMHSKEINSICLTFDELFCISASDDNSIVFWKMTDSEGRVSKFEKDIPYSTEVLVSRSELEEKHMILGELRQKLGEQRLEADFTMKRREATFQEEIRDLTYAFNAESKKLNDRLTEAIKGKEIKEREFHDLIKSLEKGQEDKISNIDAHYSGKLIGEYEKYNTIQNLLEETIKEYESRLVKCEEERTKAFEELVSYFEGKIKDKNVALDQAFNEARKQLLESEEMKKQIEEDADDEILNLKTNYEKKLKNERDVNEKLRSEAGIMRKKFQTMQKEIEEQKSEVLRMLAEGSKMKTVIQSTEKEISTLRKDLVDRDNNVHDKEKVIYELKKSNNELEKFKFVLDYKIKELKKMIEPKEREIIYLKQQNRDMENELDQTIALKNGLELQITELANKLKIADSEMQKEKRSRWKLSILVFRIRSELSRAMTVIQDFKALKNIVKETYLKYGHSIDLVKATKNEQEAICELVRQKNHLESSLNSVKKQIIKDVEFTRSEQLKIMHENMHLVYEINSLRKELKNCRDKINSYEQVLGIGQAAEMRMKLHLAVQDRDEIDLDHFKDIENKDNTIKAQQAEIDNLSNKIVSVTAKEVGEREYDSIMTSIPYNKRTSE